MWSWDSPPGREATSATAPAPSPRTEGVPRRAWVVFAAAVACSFQTTLALAITNVAFPSLRDEFDEIDEASLSWVLNLYTIVAGASLIVASVMVERLGRKRMLVVGAAGFSIASLACACAPTVGLLLAARVVQAVASALVTPASVAVIVREFPDTHRATAVAGWAAVGSVAAAVGPGLGGILVDAGSWRWAFAALVPGGVVGVVLVVRLVGESRDPEPRPIPDLLGALLIVASVGSIIGGLVQSRPWGWTDPLVPGSIAVGTALGVLLVVRSSRHDSPVLELSLFGYRSFSAANVGSFVFGTGFFAAFIGYVLFLTDAWNQSARDAGLLLSPLAIAAALTSPFAGRQVRRRGAALPLAVGGLLVGLGALLLLVRAGPEPAVVGLWLPAMVLTGTGAGLVWPSIFASVVAEVPADRYATATGINQTIQRISTAFGVTLAVTLIGPSTGASAVDRFDGLFVLCASSGLATSILAAFVGRGNRRVAPT